MTQTQFAQAVGLSRSNIARYESGDLGLTQAGAEKIYGYAFTHGFDINKSKVMLYEDDVGDSVLLFHGCREEIQGIVDTHHSVPPNDFGEGFYLGQTLEQANSWVAAYPGSSTYCFLFRPDRFKGMKFSIDYRWMYAILYYRGALEGYVLPDEIQQVIDGVKSCDFLVAPIADNQMYDTLRLFKEGVISDVACLHALNANNLGRQFVLKTDAACLGLTPLDRLYLCQEERDFYLSAKDKTSSEGRSKSLLAMQQYRKEGRTFHEIFKEKR